jgi:hypothetical protein
MGRPDLWFRTKQSLLRLLSLLTLGLGAAFVPQTFALPVSADTTNDQPWVAGAPIPADPGGGAFTGATEGACTAMIGGKIYVAFGFDPIGGDTRGFRIYDPTTNIWSLGPTPPSLSGRSEGYRGVAHGGKLYCIGGRPTAETWIFDTGTNMWSPGAPEPDPLLRAGATAATYGNSIFMFGGRHVTGGPCSGAAVTNADVDGTILRYDVDQNAWFPAGNMAFPRSDTSVARVGGLIYIFGGCNGTAYPPDVEVYNPRTQTSTVLSASFPGGARSNATAADPQNGSSANASHRIHVVGGWRQGGFLGTFNHVIFDVDQQTFVVGVPLPTHCSPGVDRAEHETVYGGDRLFAVGGSCPAFGLSENNLDIQKLSDPPAQSASVTASSCSNTTFPICAVQPLGSSLVFATGTGFHPLSTITLRSSLQGALAPAVSDVQGAFVTTYLDTVCTGQPGTVTASDGANTASIALTCR